MLLLLQLWLWLLLLLLAAALQGGAPLRPPRSPNALAASSLHGAHARHHHLPPAHRRASDPYFTAVGSAFH